MKFKESKSAFNIEDNKSHRQNIQYSSESSDYETEESSDSSDCDEFFHSLRKNVAPVKFPDVKTKGELTPEDLPPVEDLHLTVNSTELLKIGLILHWVVAEERKEFLVIVESDGNSNPLDEDSVLFLASDKPLGKIQDVFGNVSKPKYVVRFNKAEDIFNKGVTTGQIVYYSPTNGELTHYVLVDVLKKQKGSDASWKDNNEPPDDEIDYSDDEQEKLAKQKRRAKTRGKEQNWNDGEVEDVTPNKMERRVAAYNQKRVFKRPSRNMFESPTSSFPHRYSQSLAPPSTFTVPSSFMPAPLNNVHQSRVPPPSTFTVPSSFMPAPLNNVPQSRVPSPSTFTVPSSFMSAPLNNVPQSRVPPLSTFTVPSSFMSAPLNNVPQSRVPPPSTFAVPSSFMPAPLNNVPPQQQLLSQSWQPITSFLSRPPPNYNYHQNSRTLSFQNYFYSHKG